MDLKDLAGLVCASIDVTWAGDASVPVTWRIRHLSLWPRTCDEG
jgi:hypothetical protein